MKVEVEERTLSDMIGAMNDTMRKNNRVIEEVKRLLADDGVDASCLVGLVIEESLSLSELADNVVSLVENGVGLNHV